MTHFKSNQTTWKEVTKADKGENRAVRTIQDQMTFFLH